MRERRGGKAWAIPRQSPRAPPMQKLVLLTVRQPLGVLCVSSWWKRKKRRVEARDRAVPTPRGKGERRGLCAGMFLHVSAQSSKIRTTNEEARRGRWMCAINRSITRWSSLVAHPHMRSEYQTTAWRKAALDGPQHPQAPRCASPSSPDNSSASSDVPTVARTCHFH